MPSRPVLPSLKISHSEEFNSRELSSSGFSDRSPYPPSAIATDRGSCGKIPYQPSGREVGQHFYELFDSSRSNSEASVSGFVEVAFCSRGISCCLTVADLERIRGKY